MGLIKPNTLILQFPWTRYLELGQNPKKGKRYQLNQVQYTHVTTATPEENALYRHAYTSLAFGSTYNDTIIGCTMRNWIECMRCCSRSFRVALANQSTRNIFTSITKSPSSMNSRWKNTMTFSRTSLHIHLPGDANLVRSLCLFKDRSFGDDVFPTPAWRIISASNSFTI